MQVSTSLITIPLTVHYLGNERFGLWMTISSVFAMANFADFGVGNGVLNTVADAFGKNDFDRIRAAISSGFAVLGAVGLLLLGLFASTFAWVSWADVFRVTRLRLAPRRLRRSWSSPAASRSTFPSTSYSAPNWDCSRAFA